MFPQKYIDARTFGLKNCSVSRVIGDNPSPYAICLLGKRVWKIGGELQVRRIAKGCFYSSSPRDRRPIGC